MKALSFQGWRSSGENEQEVDFKEKAANNDEILFQPLTKEYIRSVHGLLASETSVTKELLQERAKDREHEEAKLGKPRTR